MVGKEKDGVDREEKEVNKIKKGVLKTRDDQIRVRAEN